MRAPMTPQALAHQWSEWFPDCPPFSPIMRRLYRERWFRIYSLPEGKRYATSDDEIKTLLARHNDVAEAVLGGRAECAVVVAGATDDLPSLQALDLRPAEGWLDQWMSDEFFVDYLEGLGDFFVGFFTWRQGAFDELLYDIAEERAGHLLFASLRTGRIYAPYDGGANLFLESEKVRDEFSHRFAMWRSPREDGL